MVKKKTSNKNYLARSIIFIMFLVLLFTGVLIEFSVRPASTTSQDAINQNLVLHFVDVGQADATIIKLPDGKLFLIDSGLGDDKLLNYITNAFFKGKSSKIIDYFLITHPHADHIGGSVKIFENFEVKTFLRPEVYTKEELDQLIDEYGNIYDGRQTLSTAIFLNMVEVSRNEVGCQTVFLGVDFKKIEGENYYFEFLSPNKYTYSNLNNYSPVMILNYAGRRVLFSGDAESLVEKEVLNSYIGDLKVDIYKVGHHGSNTSSSQNFLEKLKPTYAIISVGKNNSYNHPHPEVLERLLNLNTTIYRTDQNGTIIIGISENGKILLAFAFGSALKKEIKAWQIILPSAVVGGVVIFTFDSKKLKKYIKNNK